MTPPEIGRAAGGTAPAPQGGETVAGAEMCECPCGAPIPGCDAHFCDDCAAGPPMTVDELYAFAEDLMDQSWFDMRNVEAFERGKKLAVLARALAQPPRPAAVADEDVEALVRRARLYGNGWTPCPNCGLEDGAAFINGRWICSDCTAPRPNDVTTDVRRVLLACADALAAPAPRDPARDAGEADARLQPVQVDDVMSAACDYAVATADESDVDGINRAWDALRTKVSALAARRADAEGDHA